MCAGWSAVGGLVLVGVVFAQACGARGYPGGPETGGTGGKGGACVPPGIGGYGQLPCGPSVPTCDGDLIAYLSYCDQVTCSGPTEIWKRTACGGVTCGGGKCLTHLGPSAKSCSIATDCGLPDTVCLAQTEQLVYSDPSCDDGECHWKEIVNDCGTLQGTTFTCTGGTCYDPGAMTRAPITPTPTPDSMQPPPAPEQACTATAECTQPPPACFRDWVVSYVHGACRAGLCSWEIDLDQCAGTCGNGVCVGP